MIEVPLYTAGQYLKLDHNSADRLECLMFNADNGVREDVHKFTLCFEKAVDGVFFMPGVYWVREFEKRLGPLLKTCEIRLAVGTAGAPSQHDRQCGSAPVKGKRERRD
jgi:hypothetical protein